MARLIAAALLLLVAPATGQDLSRADPTLRYLLMTRPPPSAPVEPRLAPDRPAPPPGLLAEALDRVAGELRVRVLVRVGPGGEAALREAGASIGARAGDIVTARVPLAAVPELLERPGIVAMEAAAPLRSLGLLARPGVPGTAGPRAGPLPARAPAPTLDNDSAASDARFDELRQRAGSSWEGLNGAGVIVGVYDSGLDLTHEDFRDATGGTRVLFAWDQTDSTTGPVPGAVGPHTFAYGSECTAAAIDAGDCGMVDTNGHGTHVAGTAASDGSATGRDQPAWRFPGGAPAADLIIVKGSSGTAFTSDAVIDGVAYIFARAEALGRPAVVNLSMASLNGPHDGSTTFEQALNALAGPGRIIVAGAGNGGDHRNTTTFPVARNGPFHAEGEAGGSHGVRIPAYTPRPGATNDAVLLELWYDGADSLSITVTSPRGDAVTVATGDTATLRTPGGAIAVMNALDGPSPTNGDHSAVIGMVDAEETAPPDTGLWQIDVQADAVHGPGVHHLWFAGSSLAGTVPWLEGGTTNRYLVGAPGSADRVIAVGAHATRHRWTTPTGGIGAYPDREELGDIAYFSSPGPRRDGVGKPDLTAPGKVLISSFSKDATLWDGFPWLVESDSVHVGNFGTSMSSPQVAAAVAVLLQLESGLTPEEAKDALQLSAATDGFVTATVPNPVWGAGKLDAAAAARRLRPEGLAPGEAVNLSANPVRGDVLVINYRTRPRSVAVYTLTAERVRTFSDEEIGELNTHWRLDNDDGTPVANGAYVLVVELSDRRVVRKIFVARP
ncbi:MAG: S8 family serine peptidase [Gemmatimonadota bacterium]